NHAAFGNARPQGEDGGAVIADRAARIGCCRYRVVLRGGRMIVCLGKGRRRNTKRECDCSGYQSARHASYRLAGKMRRDAWDRPGSCSVFHDRAPFLETTKGTFARIGKIFL